jgi:nickel-dependent lactate racemase
MSSSPIIGTGSPSGTLAPAELDGIVAQAVGRMDADGQRVLVIVPDGTRTCPLPAVARALHRELSARRASVDFLIALGTHPPMSDEQIGRLFGVTAGQWAQTFGQSRVFNHAWQDRAALTQIGVITADEIDRLCGPAMSGFRMDVPVAVNRLLLEYDRVLIVGPVFPHEVVGFSGGNKYFFPGVCGPELLNYFHWLGAILTCPRIIGAKHTPVRALIDRAATMIPTPRWALCLVVAHAGLAGAYFGKPEEAWSAAADLSHLLHVTHVEKLYESVLAAAPAMYDELWTAGKCMYKLESVVADGGELIIYAPHVTEVSYTHGRTIDQVGYHTRDYFLAQWDRFKHLPWGVLAHSTHVRGVGTFVGGVETGRIRVTLATGILEDRCRKLNLGYRDWRTLRPEDWQTPNRLYVPQAGEMLYKLATPPAT